jgi:hypothetical protein
MLDTELKREYQQFLQEHNRGKSDSDGRPDRSPDEIARWAMDHDLPEKDGHVQFPDARIVYEDRDGREHTRDIEVETLNYRGAHASAKASSGFSRHSAAGMRVVGSRGAGGGGSLLFRDQLSAARYGLTEVIGDGPILLKPHGSLNWYESSAVKQVPSEKRTVVFESTGDDVHERVEVFRFPRGIKSKVGNRYSPLLVPPTFLKDFRRPIFRRLWKNCTDALSTPKMIVFLGYSLPMADLHAQFIFRCGFHNQIEGRLKTASARHPATGAADVIIVNPDQSAARRIESVAGPKISCRWVPTTVEGWLKMTS